MPGMGIPYVEGIVTGPTGVVTLEILGLVLHPFNRTLQPARLLLA